MFRKKDRGFTLIELVVVLAIITLLTAIVAPNASNIIGSSSQNAANANARAVYTAAKMYLSNTLARGKMIYSLSKSDVKDYLGRGEDGQAAITLTSDMKNVYQVVWWDPASPDIKGYYPLEAADDIGNRFVNAVNTDDIRKILKVYYDKFKDPNKWGGGADINKAVDSEAPKKIASNPYTYSAQIKDALGEEFGDTGSWRIVKTRKLDPATGKYVEDEYAIYWTAEPIADKAVGTPVDVYKYLWNPDTNCFELVGIGTVKVAKRDNYKVLLDTTYTPK